MACQLVSTYWQAGHAERQAELETCLRLNELAFDCVTILSERVPRPSWFRGRWFEGSQRQTFADLIALAADTAADDVVVLANTDIIMLTESLAVIETHIRPGEAYALSRWDLLADGQLPRLFNCRSSQDTWVFRGPPRAAIGGHYRHAPGCDNRFAHEIAAAGYRVTNPARTIQTWHLHRVPIRNTNRAEDRIPLPYLFIRPARLGAAPCYHCPTTLSDRPSFYRGARAQR